MTVRVGSELVNPVTGERAVVRAMPTPENGHSLVVDLYLQPGAAVAGEHLPPALEEAFTVLSEQVGMRLNRHVVTAPLGERVVIPAGVRHDWWNAGDGEAYARVEVEPAERFLEMAHTLFGLAQDGKTNAQGMPNPLQLVLFGKEFEDVVVFTRLPHWIFNLAYVVLTPLARLLGYRGSYDKYLEPLNSQPPPTL